MTRDEESAAHIATLQAELDDAKREAAEWRERALAAESELEDIFDREMATWRRG